MSNKIISPNSFPFGWIRDFNGDNWQIIWNKGTKEIYLKSTKRKEFKKLYECSSWFEAKTFADVIISNPENIEI